MFTSNTPHRLPGLDLLRAIAIVWVMAYHLVSHGPRLPAIVDLGWMGVDLFFVLSGFLIGGQVFAASRAGTLDWRDYLVRRALRVLPAYFAVLALYLWLPVWRESAGLAPAWQFLSFTSNLFPDYARYRAFSHAWSLCVEEHFYLLLPLAVIVLSRRPSARKSALFVLAVLAGGMALRGWTWLSEVGPYLAPSNGALPILRYVEHIYNPTWARLDGLLLGAALAAVKLFRPNWWAWMMERGWLFLTAGLAGLWAAGRLFEGAVPGFTAVVAGFPLLSVSLACILVGAASPHTLPGRVALPGARLLATLAFSLYLTHKAVYHLVAEYFAQVADSSNLAALVVHNGAALAAAGLLYLVVERPGLRLRERLSGAASRIHPHSGTRRSACSHPPCAAPAPRIQDTSHP